MGFSKNKLWLFLPDPNLLTSPFRFFVFFLYVFSERHQTDAINNSTNYKKVGFISCRVSIHCLHSKHSLLAQSRMIVWVIGAVINSMLGKENFLGICIKVISSTKGAFIRIMSTSSDWRSDTREPLSRRLNGFDLLGEDLLEIGRHHWFFLLLRPLASPRC